MEHSVILFRILLTFILALIFGLERQKSHKPIGFGTFIFVSIGSSALALTATVINSENPLPLLGAIITGIGFLGAGALIKTTDKIFGFTTAASIWTFSIMGLLIGVGEYFIGILIYTLIWAVIFIDKFLEIKNIGSYQKKLTFTTEKYLNQEKVEELLQTSYKLVSYEQNKEEKRHYYSFLIEGTKINIYTIPKKLFDSKHVITFKIE